MKAWDWVLAALCAVWVIAVYFIVEPDAVWDWRVVAAFAQAFLSAGAIYSAWWLQQRKRASDRQEAANDTITIFIATSFYLEKAAAHTAVLGLRKEMHPKNAKAQIPAVEVHYKSLQDLNLAHLPDDAAQWAALGLLEQAANLISILTLSVDEDFSKIENLFIDRYEHLWSARSDLLEALTRPDFDESRSSPTEIRSEANSAAKN